MSDLVFGVEHTEQATELFKYRQSNNSGKDKDDAELTPITYIMVTDGQKVSFTAALARFKKIKYFV